MLWFNTLQLRPCQLVKFFRILPHLVTFLQPRPCRTFPTNVAQLCSANDWTPGKDSWSCVEQERSARPVLSFSCYDRTRCPASNVGIRWRTSRGTVTLSEHERACVKRTTMENSYHSTRVAMPAKALTRSHKRLVLRHLGTKDWREQLWCRASQRGDRSLQRSSSCEPGDAQHRSATYFTGLIGSELDLAQNHFLLWKSIYDYDKYDCCKPWLL